MINTINERRRSALAAAAIFHVLFTVGIFSVGRFGLAPNKIDRDGIGEFASDGHLHKLTMERLIDLLRQGQLRAWLNSGEAFHVRLYSIVGLLTTPLLGSNILAIEPLNLLYYLAMLVLAFRLAQIIAGWEAAWLATLLIAFWPSLVLHSTQFLRDSLVLIGILWLMNVLVVILKETLNWRRALGGILTGAAAIFVIWQTRPEMWLVIVGVLFLSTLLLVIKLAASRKLLAVNLVAMFLLAVISIGMPRPSVGVVSQPLSIGLTPIQPRSSAAPYLWIRLAIARERFITHSRGSGSLIDETVFFNSSTDIIKYAPRALEIGYFAPFPILWFRPGNNVGLAGRIISGVEMALTYLLEALACIFVWRNRRKFTSWLLALTTAMGMLALGLVVCNIGTLYRMRYPFWILIVIMAAAAIVNMPFQSKARLLTANDHR
jgi:hypothetical protein